MKILYGVQATGNGHIARSREMIKALKKKGHDVHVIFSGRDPDQLWDVEIFKPYSAFKGFTFVTRRGKLRYLPTLAQLSPIKFYRDITGFDAGSFDLAVIDFEPVSARIAKRYGLPSIGLGHQYAFHHQIPIAKRDPAAMAILKHFAPATYPLGLHWHHFGKPILPPIVPKMDPPGNSVRNKIIVYLPFEEQEDVLKLLRPFKDYNFHYYTGVDFHVRKDNIYLHPFSRDGFLTDLKDSSGVICNAGFELSSEALHLGKKLLVRPLSGQLEQTSNALAIEKLKLGMSMDVLDPEVVRKWLNSDPLPPVSYPDVAGIIADWMEKGAFSNVESLVKEVWSAVPDKRYAYSAAHEPKTSLDRRMTVAGVPGAPLTP